MAKRIQLHTFHLLFRIFSFLADKSGGWSMFVRPKLIIGTLIVGMGLSSCDIKTRNKPTTTEENKQNSVQKSTEQNKPDDNSTITCYASTSTLYVDEYDSNYKVEQMPEFPGGTDSLMQYINQHLSYPRAAIKEGIEGIVICGFTINTDGSITNIYLIRGLNSSLDKEAIRLIKSFPKWIPGKQGGKAVPVKFTLPICFTLPEKKK